MDPLTPHPLDVDAPGGMVINPHSALGKELCRWEQHRTEYVGRGMNPGNPYVFRQYPRMLYKAQRQSNGQYACMLPAPNLYDFERPDLFERACLQKDSFDRSCQRIVADESAERLAVGQGWSLTAPDALAAAESREQAIGNAAAEAAFAAQRMTDKARRELAEADTQTHEHVVDVKPARKRGRAAKGRPVAVSATEAEA